MKLEFEVEGMSCLHCVNRIKNAIQEIPKVEKVDISLEDKKVEIVITDKMSDVETKIREAIEEMGYNAIRK